MAEDKNVFDFADGERSVREVNFVMERESLRYSREFTEEEEVKLL